MDFECKDHFIPWSKDVSDKCLPCCRSCNMFLYDHEFKFLHERLKYLKTRIKNKHRKIFTRNYQRILRGTRGFLKKEILKEKRFKTQLAKRIQWIDKMILLLPDLDLLVVRKNEDEMDRLLEAVDACFLRIYGYAR